MTDAKAPAGTSDEIAALIAKVALADRQAFDLLYERTSAKLFGVVLRILKDRADAEDAIQDVFVKIWHRADRYAVTKASPMSWLVAVARNHAIDRLRARPAAAEDVDTVIDLADGAPTPEAQAVRSSERGRIEDCFGRLEDDRAAAVKGAYLEGFSYQELAGRFEVPLNTMKTWLRRSLMKLKECLEE